MRVRFRTRGLLGEGVSVWTMNLPLKEKPPIRDSPFPLAGIQPQGVNDSDWKLPLIFRPKPAKAQTPVASVWGRRSDRGLPRAKSSGFHSYKSTVSKPPRVGCLACSSGNNTQLTQKSPSLGRRLAEKLQPLAQAANPGFRAGTPATWAEPPLPQAGRSAVPLLSTRAPHSRK